MIVPTPGLKFEIVFKFFLVNNLEDLCSDLGKNSDHIRRRIIFDLDIMTRRIGSGRLT